MIASSDEDIRAQMLQFSPFERRVFIEVLVVKLSEIADLTEKIQREFSADPVPVPLSLAELGTVGRLMRSAGHVIRELVDEGDPNRWRDK